MALAHRAAGQQVVRGLGKQQVSSARPTQVLTVTRGPQPPTTSPGSIGRGSTTALRTPEFTSSMDAKNSQHFWMNEWELREVSLVPCSKLNFLYHADPDGARILLADYFVLTRSCGTCCLPKTACLAGVMIVSQLRKEDWPETSGARCILQSPIYYRGLWQFTLPVNYITNSADGDTNPLVKKNTVISIYGTQMNTRQGPIDGNSCFLGQYFRHWTMDG